MKKFLSILSAITILTSCVACSENKSDSSISEIAEPATEVVNVSQTIYKETKIPVSAIKTPFKIQMCGENCYFFYENNQHEICLLILDKDFNAISDTVLCDSINIGFSAYVNEDGSFYTVSAETDFVFEYDDFGNISNYNDFINENDARFIFTHYDSSCNIILQNEIIGLKNEFDISQSSLNDLCPYGENKLILSIRNGLSIIDTEGTLIDSQHYDMQSIGLGCDSDGKVVASMYHGYGYMDGETLKLPESLLGEYEERLKIENSAQPAGNGFKLYFQRKDGIYGLTENDELVLVFDFSESLINTSDISCYTPCGDGKFITAKNDSKELFLYTRRPDDFNNDREVIDIWYISGGDDGHKAVEFNKTNDKYLARVNPALKTLDALKEAVLTGKEPDVIEFGSYDVIEKLNNLGALADMNELIDKYGYINRDEIMPNVLEAFNMDGKLYALPEFFSVKGFIANSDYIGKEYQNWTYEDLYRFCDNRPDGMYIFVNNYGGLLYSLCTGNMSRWIDTENNTCKFDSPEFIKLLKFCKDNPNSDIPNPNEERGATEVEQMEYMKKSTTSLRDNIAMLENTSIYGLSDLVSTIGSFGITYDKASILNPPGSNGIGNMCVSNCFGIMENSDCKEGALAYVGYLLGEEYQCSLVNNECCINWTNKKAFDIAIKSCITGDEPKFRKCSWSIGKSVLEYDVQCNITEEQAKEYCDFIMNCTNIEYHNNELSQIIQEEYDRYINDEITVEECAEMIQNRASIYLSEKY